MKMKKKKKKKKKRRRRRRRRRRRWGRGRREARVILEAGFASSDNEPPERVER